MIYDESQARFWRACWNYGQQTLRLVAETRDRIYPEGKRVAVQVEPAGPIYAGTVFGHFADLEIGLLVQLDGLDVSHFGKRRVRGLENVVHLEWDQVAGPVED